LVDSLAIRSNIGGFGMKRAVIALCVALALGLAVHAQEKKVSDGPVGVPKLVIDATSHDFGRVKAGAALTHTFKIKNEGGAELNIQSVTPG